MDILDNIIFATHNSSLQNNVDIEGKFIQLPPNPVPIETNPGQPVSVFSYGLADKLNYCSFQEGRLISTGIARHWYDVDSQEIYQIGADVLSNFLDTSTYHMIYAYLIENTRVFQIFERFIEKYLTDEELGITDSAEVFNWIANSELLFFKSDSPKATNLRSVIRPNSDSSRRNAYYRLLGMDLAFGDIDSKSNTVPYYKAKAANQQFVPLFERYLSEIWQGYINARNSAGVNTSDVNVLVELAQQIQEMLAARRGNPNNTYAQLNLSREEYSAVLMSNWFTFIISYDSPVVTHLSCQSSTIGERLLKIGEKVGIPAHRKCQALFEMADSAAQILLSIEASGIMDDGVWVQTMLSSLNPGTPPSIHGNFMNHLLTVINNWEKATGHPIKNPERNISGTVKVLQNSMKSETSFN